MKRIVSALFIAAAITGPARAAVTYDEYGNILAAAGDVVPCRQDAANPDQSYCRNGSHTVTAAEAAHYAQHSADAKAYRKAAAERHSGSDGGAFNCSMRTAINLGLCDAKNDPYPGAGALFVKYDIHGNCNGNSIDQMDCYAFNRRGWINQKFGNIGNPVTRFDVGLADSLAFDAYSKGVPWYSCKYVNGKCSACQMTINNVPIPVGCEEGAAKEKAHGSFGDRYMAFKGPGAINCSGRGCAVEKAVYFGAQAAVGGVSARPQSAGASAPVGRTSPIGTTSPKLTNSGSFTPFSTSGGSKKDDGAGTVIGGSRGESGQD